MVDATTLAAMIESAVARDPDRVAGDDAIMTFVRVMKHDDADDELACSA